MLTIPVRLLYRALLFIFRLVCALLFLLVRQPLMALLGCVINIFIYLVTADTKKCFNPFKGEQFWWRVRLWEEDYHVGEDRVRQAYYYKTALDVLFNRTHIDIYDY